MLLRIKVCATHQHLVILNRGRMQQASNTPESPQACATFAADNIDYNHIDSGRGKALLDWLQASANSKIVHRSVCLCGCSIAWQLSFEASKVHVWQCCCGRGSYHAPWMTIISRSRG